ncbi:ABC transporter permease [Anaerofilum sp. BX8]|uniref:ABC transporter permease n=1 Tax=Anaerofilum hominis TaxID=2763016 RepID=A0A923KYK9_9FIRM|nr:ABC transporter permease [Anaerofilum hominis]MBC5582159.1 ABC transporter permease [Anaerofilum hominis]
MRKNKLTRKRWPVPPTILFLMITFAAIVGAALLAPVLAPIDLAANDLTTRLLLPTFRDPASPHLLGTDNLGRDVVVRLLYATRTTISISFTGMLIATAIGTALGVLAGLCGGAVDVIISFLTDVRLSVPTTFIGIIFACVMGATPTTTIVVIAITGWSSFCRLVRSQIFQLRGAKFIEASRAMGASGLRIVFEHILVNIASPLIVQATMELSGFILLESTLSFLGLGIQPPGTSLGVMVSTGRDYMLTHWWLAIAPSAVIIVLILQISLVGDWLRDKLDPKLKNAS